MVSNVNFEYYDLNKIEFDDYKIKTGGIILMIGKNKENKIEIINKLKKQHGIETVFKNIDINYLKSKKLDSKFNREYIITNYEDLLNNLHIIHSISNYRVLLFVLIEENTKLRLDFRINIDYIFIDYTNLSDSLIYLYDNFIYMFRDINDFCKFVLSQIKKDDWIVIHNTNRKALKPEEYIYFYNELY